MNTTEDITALRKTQFWPLRSLYTEINKHHQEPIMLFGISYCWTLMDEDMQMTTQLRLVRTDRYHGRIKELLSDYKKAIA